MAEEVWKAWDRGDAVLMLDPKAPGGVTARAIATQRPETLISAAGTWTLHDPLPAWDDTAAVVLTSGTTGEPKGVELSHSALAAASRLTHGRLHAAPGDRWTCVLPLHHVAGLTMLPRARSLGSEIEFLDPSDIASLGEAEGSFVSLVPTQLSRCLDRGIDLARFKAVLLGGASVDPETLRRAVDAGIKIVRTYGMTETTGGVVYDGIPLDEVSVRVGGSVLEGSSSPGGPEMKSGDVYISSPTLMSGYRGGERFGGGWFETKDVGSISDGRLSILGRADDIINTGGEKVVPRVVEAAAMKQAGVKDAFVMGVPDPEWGQAVVAFVVADPAIEGVLKESLGTELLRHEVPKKIVFLTEIPRNSGGKVDVAALRNGAPGNL